MTTISIGTFRNPRNKLCAH